MKKNDRRAFLGKTVAVAAGAAVVTAKTASAQDKPVKKVLYKDGKKPEKTPMFNSTVTVDTLFTSLFATTISG